MTATDDLRLLLDEHGVEHYDHEDDEPLRDLSEAGPDPATSWRMGDASVCAVPDKNGTLDIWIDHASPEQAIAATLGNDGLERTNDGVAERGTCHMEYAVWDDGTCVWGCICSGCGRKFEYETGEGWSYCPKCGREVVE